MALPSDWTFQKIRSTVTLEEHLPKILAITAFICAVSIFGRIMFRQDRKEFNKILFSASLAISLGSVWALAQALSPAKKDAAPAPEPRSEATSPPAEKTTGPATAEQVQVPTRQGSPPQTWGVCEGVDSVPPAARRPGAAHTEIPVEVRSTALQETERLHLAARVRSLLEGSAGARSGSVHLQASVSEDSTAYPAPTTSVELAGEFQAADGGPGIPVSSSVRAVGATPAASRRNALSCAAAAAAARVISGQAHLR